MKVPRINRQENTRMTHPYAEHDITAELLHRADCSHVLEIAVDDALRNVLGESR
ncbi:hypothetical protein [Saccharomonospora sp. CUA-673]|uniref:hypothetical protein n=1 Tax=Saccharomonospora sp. CUA-673 TaxID=1904969 RepID=UPI00130184B8|nr:hypothetical protein [Saccharomonospora sp. CUA-673]